MFSKEVILDDYLSHGVYPPVPRADRPFVVRAIEMANDGDINGQIVLDGARLCNAVTGEPVTPFDVIAALNLWDFLDEEAV
jgi:hypothetical protein